MRLMLQIGGMIAANLAVCLGAHAILRRVRSGVHHLDFLIFILLRILILSATVLVAAMVHLYSSVPLGLAGVLALVTLLLAREHRYLPRVHRPEASAIVIGFALALTIRLALQVWFFAPFLPDALSYHLPKIGEWVQHCGFTREWGPDRRSTFPSGFELVEAWWVVFLRHDALIEMAGVEFLVLAAGGANALARGVGLSRKSALLTALFYAATPALLLQSVACLNDGAAAAILVTAAALLLGRVHMGLVLLTIGLGVGIKPTVAYALPGLLALWAWVRRTPAVKIGSGRCALGLGLAGLVVGASWYVRNLYFFGNPIHPMGWSGIKATNGNTLQRLGPSFATLMENLRRLIDSRFDDHWEGWSALCEMTAGWGPAAFACGVAGLLTGARENRPLRALSGAFLISLVSVLLLVQSDIWFPRFALFFPALLALGAAWVVETCPRVGIVAASAVTLQFIGTMADSRMPVGAVRDLALQDWNERAVEVLPKLSVPVDAVGCYGGDTVRAYSLYRPDFSRRVVYLRPSTADELAVLMEKGHLRVLFSNLQDAIITESLRRGRLRRLIGSFYERLP